MKNHPLADLYPAMSEENFAALKSSIETDGLLHPVVTIDGLILDGRHRYRACTELGVPANTVDYDGPTDDESLFRYVHAENDCRRHYTEGQLAFIANEKAAYFRERARERQVEGNRKGAEVTNAKKRSGNDPLPERAVSQRLSTAERKAAARERVRDQSKRALVQAAASVGAGIGSTAKVAKVQRQAPEVYAMVGRGEVNVSDASKLARLDKPLRTDAVARVKRGEARNVTAAVQAVVRDATRKELAARVTAPSTEHRVIVGDAVEALRNLPENSAHLLLTDPPYGLDNHRARADGPDYADGFEYATDLFDKVCQEAKRVLVEGAHIYVFAGYEHLFEFKRILQRHFDVDDVFMIWAKDNHTMRKFEDGPASDSEFVWFARNGGDRPMSNSVTRSVQPWRREKSHHSARKPVPFLKYLIENSTVEGETVLDPFLGSGSTLEAAKATKRAGVGIEKKPDIAAAAEGALA